MSQEKTTIEGNVSAWQRCLAVLQWAIKRFDPNDAHFYAGMAMLFLGLWLTYSLGVALTVCGTVVAAVGFVCALINIFLPVWFSARGGKR